MRLRRGACQQGQPSAQQLGAQRGQERGRRGILENRWHSSGRACVPAVHQTRRLSTGAWISWWACWGQSLTKWVLRVRSEMGGKVVW